uniref:Uncharacterized protein n=1 Tax=Arundo donax TaxID=35708 RepID=A0A0A9CZ64_ARUDO
MIRREAICPPSRSMFYHFISFMNMASSLSINGSTCLLPQ